MKCNLCNYNGDFLPMGERKYARCPECKSLERHREFVEIADLKGSVLHISPNPGLRQFYEKKYGHNYKSSIYETGGWNLEDKRLDKIDNIIAIHVIEHIKKNVFKNLHTALNNNGILWLQIPFEKELREDLGHKTKFTKQGLKLKLAKAGFRIEIIKGFYKCTKSSGKTA